MTIEQAAERLKELPGEWWWSVGYCHRTSHATVAPDYAPSDEMRAFDERFNSGFDADLRHITGHLRTPAEALVAAIDKAKAAVAAWEARP
jgi:hypothetical protein